MIRQDRRWEGLIRAILGGGLPSFVACCEKERERDGDWCMSIMPAIIPRFSFDRNREVR